MTNPGAHLADNVEDATYSNAFEIESPLRSGRNDHQTKAPAAGTEARASHSSHSPGNSSRGPAPSRPSQRNVAATKPTSAAPSQKPVRSACSSRAPISKTAIVTRAGTATKTATTATT